MDAGPGEIYYKQCYGEPRTSTELKGPSASPQDDIVFTSPHGDIVFAWSQDNIVFAWSHGDIVFAWLQDDIVFTS